MEKWRDNYRDFWVPLKWHGPDDDGEGAEGDAGTIDDGNTDDSAGEGAAGGGQAPSKMTKKKVSDTGGDDDITDDVPEDINSLSAAELRELIRAQGAELKKTRVTARKRLHEIMEKKEKHRELEEKQEAARLKELEEKEEYKKLYTELAPKYEILKKDIGKTHQHLEVQFEKAKESLPEEYHGLIPDVDIRDKIAWVSNFKSTVIAKQKPPAKDAPPKVDDTDQAPPKKNTGGGVGSGGTPPEGGEGKKTTRETIEAAIDNCKGPEELDRLIKGLSKQGIQNM